MTSETTKVLEFCPDTIYNICSFVNTDEISNFRILSKEIKEILHELYITSKLVKLLCLRFNESKTGIIHRTGLIIQAENFHTNIKELDLDINLLKKHRDKIKDKDLLVYTDMHMVKKIVSIHSTINFLLTPYYTKLSSK